MERGNSMIDEVKTCVNARVNYFEEYFSVPDQMKEDIDSFIQDMETLGNCCGSVAEFEQTFVSSGLSDRFYALIAKCTPRARKMTKEEKQHSMSVAQDILYEQRSELAKNAATEIVGGFISKKRDERIEESHRQMIEDGTHVAFTIRRNRIQDAERLLDFLGRKIKKQEQ